ncbi:MAG: hypothetical protein HC933_23230 [Pleurocapsa sp. SU_196_0]|nr:hypothetical protein [Pleurocapsa sp. SU_196_0]
MTATSQGILNEAQSQASIADLAQSQTSKVTESIRQLAQTAERGAQTARETLDASAEGQRAVTNTQAQLLSIRNEIANIASGAQSLERRSSEISEVVRTISRFASQTNLLALGASLEAAGAGEAGARFAAVANAVRGLADESAKAATRVTGLVRDVQPKSSDWRNWRRTAHNRRTRERRWLPKPVSVCGASRNSRTNPRLPRTPSRASRWNRCRTSNRYETTCNASRKPRSKPNPSHAVVRSSPRNSVR